MTPHNWRLKNRGVTPSVAPPGVTHPMTPLASRAANTSVWLLCVVSATNDSLGSTRTSPVTSRTPLTTTVIFSQLVSASESVKHTTTAATSIIAGRQLTKTNFTTLDSRVFKEKKLCLRWRHFANKRCDAFSVISFQNATIL